MVELLRDVVGRVWLDHPKYSMSVRDGLYVCVADQFMSVPSVQKNIEVDTNAAYSLTRDHVRTITSHFPQDSHKADCLLLLWNGAGSVES